MSLHLITCGDCHCDYDELDGGWSWYNLVTLAIACLTEARFDLIRLAAAHSTEIQIIATRSRKARQYEAANSAGTAQPQYQPLPGSVSDPIKSRHTSSVSERVVSESFSMYRCRDIYIDWPMSEARLEASDPSKWTS